jgi:hypothetical protein
MQWKSPTPHDNSKKDLHHHSPERKAKSSMGAHAERNFNIGHPSLQADNQFVSCNKQQMEQAKAGMKPEFKEQLKKESAYLNALK